MKDSYFNKILSRSYSAVSSSDGRKFSSGKPPRQSQSGCFGSCCENVCKKRSQKCILVLAFLGLFLLVGGISILLVQPYDFLFKWKVLFEDGGEIFEMWRTPPVDLYLRVYLFNVTNKDAFLRGEERLKVEEVGPYVYREKLSHENVTFNDNGTLSTVPSHPLEWVPELSEGRLETDQLILPNIALLSIAHVVASESIFTQFGLNVLIRQIESQPLVQMSAREFMFGYESALMSLGYNFLPNWIDFNKLGLIDRMYNFDGDFETVYTGETDIELIGLIDTYRGSHSLPQWEGRCGNVHDASDATKFKGYIKEGEKLSFFRKSMCRAQTMVQVNKTAISGLEAYRYEFEANENDNGKYRPENKCFCREGQCLPAGLLDVTDCYYGFPIATSYPHFLGADPEVIQVDGIKPDPEKHTSYFVIQPQSGLPLEVAARFQINMYLGDLSAIANVEQFSNLVLPMLWTENRMYALPDSLSMRFNLYLNVAPLLENILQYILIIVGVLVITLAAYKFYCRLRSIKNNRQFYVAATWLEDGALTGCEDGHKLCNGTYYVPEKRASLSSRELETYISSLTAPLNQDIREEDNGGPAIA